MSYSIDTNILVFASDEGSPHHGSARSFLAKLQDDPDILCLTWGVLMGYQRIVTHPSIFRNPLAPAEAWGNIRSLLGLKRCRIIVELEGFEEDFESIADTLQVRGNLVPDTHFATILRQHGVRTVYSADSDFLKFGFLKVINPLATPLR